MNISTPRLRRPGTLIAAGILAAGIPAALVMAGRRTAPDLPTADVTRGEFVETLELRGEIKPVRSIILTSPMQSGELQIVKLARNGGAVKAGDIVVEFDASTLRRTIQEKQSELKQAAAEIDQGRAQSRITEEQNATALMKASYDVQRAKLDLNRGDIVSRVDQETAKLAFDDAEHKLKDLEQKITSDRVSAEADLAAKIRKRDKAQFDLDRAEDGLKKLQLKAPADGIVNVLPNYRAGSIMGTPPEFRQGDRAWPGAAIIELPDLSSVHLLARLDETDRSRLQAGQEAGIRIEAVPGREFKAKIDSISMLARVDYMSTWPPPRNFDLDLLLLEIDPRIRPGMTAVARIAAGRVPNVTLIPTEAIFQRNGSTVVYRLNRSGFEERPIVVGRRGKDQAIVSSGIAPGDRVATKRPAPDTFRRSE